MQNDTAPQTSTGPPYVWENRPTGHSWVNSLTAEQAKQQCTLWGLQPRLHLEENRVLLKDHIKGPALTLPPGNPPLTHTPNFDNLGSDTNLSIQNAQPQLASATTPQWTDLIQATAAAVGQHVASAIAQSITFSEGNRTTDSANIPKVVSDMVSKLPKVSGSHTHQILHLLASLKDISKLNLVSDHTLILHTLPKTDSQLRTLWHQAVTSKASLSQLQNSVLEQFLPGRVRQQVISETIYRVQKPHETLSDFVQTMQTMTDILLPSFRDNDLLDVILTGLNPTTRARLAGFPAPSSVQDLLTLAPRLEVVRTTELQFNQEFTTPQANIRHPNRPPAHFYQPHNFYSPQQNYQSRNRSFQRPPQHNSPRQFHNSQFKATQNSATHSRPQQPQYRSNNHNRNLNSRGGT